MCRDKYAFCLGRTATHLLPFAIVYFALSLSPFLCVTVLLLLFNLPTGILSIHSNAPPHTETTLSLFYLFFLSFFSFWSDLFTYAFFSSSVCLFWCGSTRGYFYIFGASFAFVFIGLGIDIWCPIRLFNFLTSSRLSDLTSLFIFFFSLYFHTTSTFFSYFSESIYLGYMSLVTFGNGFIVLFWNGMEWIGYWIWIWICFAYLSIWLFDTYCHVYSFFSSLLLSLFFFLFFSSFISFFLSHTYFPLFPCLIIQKTGWCDVNVC